MSGSDTSEGEVAVAETTVSESGADPEGFFDDIDEETSAEGQASPFSGVEEPEDSDTGDSDRGSLSSSLEDDINRGAARMAVIGLDDEWTTPEGKTQTKEDLRQEFEETFQAFRFGKYAGEVAQEYLMVEEDIHPALGLLGAALACAAMVVYRRPDGDKFVGKVQEKTGSDISLGSLSGVLPIGDSNDDNEKPNNNATEENDE